MLWLACSQLLVYRRVQQNGTNRETNFETNKEPNFGTTFGTEKFGTTFGINEGTKFGNIAAFASVIFFLVPKEVENTRNKYLLNAGQRIVAMDYLQFRLGEAIL
jgi:hypothetical protein